MSIVILISGRGSNLQAILDAGLPVAAVISNKPDAAGLAVAARRGVKTALVQHKDYASRDEFDAALAAEVAKHAPQAVALAGFMRILTPRFVAQYADRLVNIHPSLLPAFTGLDTHARALAAGVKLHGCTVHFVTSELDHGPIIAQAAVPVLGGDTEAALAARVLRQEHLLYPRALAWLLEGRLVIDKGSVHVKGQHASQLLFTAQP
ncbi:MAG: phosphoribosylglycinamide formyltransferase [Betaproteobacteria bacterium]|nr:phosphoribosylglycinamide formyltransferase [Betaproteobacteria bacterium]